MTNVLAQQLATRLRAFRAEHLLSQERLGHLLGKHRTYIGRIESGEENVTLANVVGLAEQLGMHPLDLLDGDLARADREAWHAESGETARAASAARAREVARPRRLRAAADGTDPMRRRRPT